MKALNHRQIENSQQITRTLLSNSLLYSPISSSQLLIVTINYEEDETDEDGLEARFTKTVAVSLTKQSNIIIIIIIIIKYICKAQISI